MYGTLVSKLVARGQGNIIILELGLLQHDLIDIVLQKDALRSKTVYQTQRMPWRHRDSGSKKLLEAWLQPVKFWRILWGVVL